MVVSDAEIRKQYNSAENKKACITRLAGLCGTTDKEMAAHIEKMGLPVPGGKKPEEPVVPGGIPLEELSTFFSQLSEQFPSARVIVGNSLVTGVCVTSRFGMDGKPLGTEVRFEAGRMGKYA